MKIHFISFADTKFSRTLDRIKNEAINSNFFDHVEIFDESFLDDEIKHYCDNNPRGYGFWIWKPIMIKKYLEKINFGDLLMYCDAGCTINSNGSERFNEYVKMLSSEEKYNDIITFNTDYEEKKWTKMDTFDFFNLHSLMDSKHVIATSIFLKKTDNTLDLINEWEYVCVNHRNLIDDSSSKNPNSEFFMDNRHDQSIFSMVVKKYDTIKLTDETYMILNGKFDNKYPIHATRIKY